MVNEPGCAACGEPLHRRLFTVDRANYVACIACGLAWIDPLPSEAELLANFAPSYFDGTGAPGGYDDYAADEPVHRRNARRRLAHIAKYRGALKPATMLDVGCAYGYALDEARTQGWSVVGVEPAPAAAQHARDLGLHVVADTEDALAGHPEGFDVVSMCQVLSHVADPAAAVGAAAKALKPGGLLFVETWRRDAFLARVAGRRWHVISPPTVVWLETSASIRALLDRAGLDVVGWKRGRKAVSLGLVASILDDQELPPLVGNVARRLGRSHWARSSLGYPFADLVWVTATSPS